MAGIMGRQEVFHMNIDPGKLERFKKYYSQSERGFLGFSEALAKEHVPKDL